MKWNTRVIKFETARTEIKKSQPFRVGVAILLGMLHAKETGISSGNLCLWLMCAFTFFTFKKSRQFFMKSTVAPSRSAARNRPVRWIANTELYFVAYWNVILI